MKLSIAMATYNGGIYLQEQLDSLLRQDRQPDELIISDDASDDDTQDIAERFKLAAPFPVVFTRNRHRLGYVKNFERAVSQASGDIIFLADQDDVWLPSKLREHECLYLNDPNVGAVIGDAAVVNHDLAPLGMSVWECMGLSKRRTDKVKSGLGLDIYIRRGFCYGILLSFRSKLCDVLLPFPPEFSHDDWITIMLSVTSQIGIIPKKLINYRQHSAQAIGVGIVKKDRSVANAEADYHSTELALRRLAAFKIRAYQFSDRWIRPDVGKVIEGRQAYLERKRAMSGRGSMFRSLIIFNNIFSGAYLRYASYSKREFLSDIRGLWLSGR